MVRRTWMAGAGLALLLLAPLAGVGALDAQERPRIAVIPFDNPTLWWGRQLGASAASQLTVRLVQTGAFTVLEREKVQAVFDEWYLGQTGAVTPSQAAEVGKLLGVEYLITGAFTSFNISTRRLGLGFGPVRGVQETKAESAMNVRVVSVGQGEIVAATQAKGDKVLGRGVTASRIDYSNISTSSPWNPTLADEALEEAIQSIANDLVSQKAKLKSTGPAPLSSRPPLIAGLAANGAVYIDQGQNTGMTVGRRFTVMRVVDEIKDRDGKVLDRVMERAGVIEVTQVLSQSSVCKVVEGKVSSETDLLEPVP